MNEEVIWLLKVFEIALIASVKFVLAPFEAERQGFAFRDAFIISTSGGFAGVLAFTFIHKVIVYSWKKLTTFFKKQIRQEERPKKKFTWFNKFIIKVKMRFGLAGLLIVTPCVISIPMGTMAIQHFYRKKKMLNVFLLFLSVLAWSFLLNGIAQYVKFSDYLPH